MPTKISALPTGTPATSDVIPYVDGSTGPTTRKVTVSVLLSLVVPNFGSQDIITTGVLKVGGATLPATGTVRLPDGFSINSITGGVDRPVLAHTGGTITIGDFTNIGQILLRTNAGAGVNLQANGVNQLVTAPNGVQLFTSTLSFGGGNMVLGVANATTDPTTNPTGGGILYSSSGAGKWRGSSGTVTTFGPADPHCPTCGRDFAVEHQNDTLGEHLALCLPCLVDALRGAGVDTSKFTITDKRGADKAAWDTAHAEARARDDAAREQERNRTREGGQVSR